MNILTEKGSSHIEALREFIVEKIVRDLAYPYEDEIETFIAEVADSISGSMTFRQYILAIEEDPNILYGGICGFESVAKYIQDCIYQKVFAEMLKWERDLLEEYAKIELVKIVLYDAGDFLVCGDCEKIFRLTSNDLMGWEELDEEEHLCPDCQEED